MNTGMQDQGGRERNDAEDTIGIRGQTTPNTVCSAGYAGWAFRETRTLFAWRRVHRQPALHATSRIVPGTREVRAKDVVPGAGQGACQVLPADVNTL